MSHFSAVHRRTVIGAGAAAVTYDAAIGNGVDAAGFASLPLRAGAKRFYVNSSTGSDSNTSTQAQSPSTPMATLLAASNYITAGAGDQVLIAQGTSYTAGLPNYSGGGGFSATYPSVIQSYDPADPTNEAKLGRASGTSRPVLNTGGLSSQRFMQGGTVTFGSYFAIRGLDFNPGSGVQLAEVSILPNTTGTHDYILFENSIFRYTALTYDNSGSANQAKARKFIVRNCSLYDEYGDHSQGIYVANVDGVTIEDNVFYANGRIGGVSRDAAQSSGGASIFNHPIYAQSNNDNTIARRNVFLDTATDGGNLKGGGIYQGNLSLRNANAWALGSGNSYSVDKPLGIYLDASFNAAVDSNIVTSTSGAIGWGVHTNNGRPGSRVHHNVLVRNSQSTGYALQAANDTDVTYNRGSTNYTDFQNNVSYLWNVSGQSTQFNGTAVVTATNNIWDDPTSGTNTNNGSVTFANAYTETSLLAALGYASEAAAIADWTNNPEQHGWRAGPSLMLAGYGVTKAQVDLTTDMRITAGIANSGQFIGTLDGYSLTATGLPSGVTLDSDGRAWHYDGSGTASSGTASITEGNGASSHTSSISWAIYAAPVLSSVSVTPGTTTATANLSTTVGSGKIYWIATTSTTTPDWQHLHIGYTMDKDGGGLGILPTAAGSPTVTATGAQSPISITGLTSATAYKFYVFQLDANNNPSAVTTSSFTTS